MQSNVSARLISHVSGPRRGTPPERLITPSTSDQDVLSSRCGEYPLPLYITLLGAL